MLPFSFARLHLFPAFTLTEVIVTGEVLDGMVYQTPDRPPYGFCGRSDGPTPTLTYVSTSRLNTLATESLSIGGLESTGQGQCRLQLATTMQYYNGRSRSTHSPET